MEKKHGVKLKTVKGQEIRILGSVLLLTLTVVFAVTVSAYPVRGETNNTTDTGIEGIDPDLVTAVWNVSVEFAEAITHEITISDDDFGGHGSIDDLITLMQITLPFTSKVLEIFQNNDRETEPEMNITLNESSLIADEMVEDAFLYLRFLQSDNLCEEAINMMEHGGTWNF
jgi:hypothetical protein